MFSEGNYTSVFRVSLAEDSLFHRNLLCTSIGCIIISLNIVHRKNKFTLSRNFRKENIGQFCNFLERVNWQEMYAQDCVNRACKIFSDTIMYYF